VTGHTYAVILNTRNERGFFYFTITEYVANKKLAIQYAVQDYQLQRETAHSRGFAWNAVNREY